MRRWSLYSAVSIFARRVITCADIPAVRPVEQPDSPKILKVAVLGSPNVGKSTLINRLIGKKGWDFKGISWQGDILGGPFFFHQSEVRSSTVHLLTPDSSVSIVEFGEGGRNVIAAVSDKPQTTREACLAVLTKGDVQILLTDTPGIVGYAYGRRHKMPKSLVSGAMVSLLGTDLAVVVVDISSKRQRMAIDDNVVRLLQEHRNVLPVLILNKVDSVRDKFSMLPTIDRLTCGRLLGSLEPGDNGITCTTQAHEGVNPQLKGGWPNFHEVLIVSAKTGEGVNRLEDYLFSLAYPGPWLYNSDESVALPPLKIIEELVREQLFAHLYQELPYIITQTNLHISRRNDDVLEIHQALNCRKDCQKAIVIGKGALTLESMRREAERQLEQLLGPVHLRLIVRVASR